MSTISVVLIVHRDVDHRVGDFVDNSFVVRLVDVFVGRRLFVAVFLVVVVVLLVVVSVVCDFVVGFRLLRP
ncbi:hypothetical protein D8S78_17650 [Natrialba swarupiae]|nr:hypothetical protein [Natrialba swarupiae]